MEQKNLSTLTEDYRAGALLELIYNMFSKKPTTWLNWFPQHKKTINKITNQKTARNINTKALKLQERLNKIKTNKIPS